MCAISERLLEFHGAALYPRDVNATSSFERGVNFAVGSRGVNFAAGSFGVSTTSAGAEQSAATCAASGSAGVFAITAFFCGCSVSTRAGCFVSASSRVGPR